MQVYNLNSFNSSLSVKPYCTDDLSLGLRIRPLNKALKCKYIQGNDRYIKFLIVDLDHNNPLIWDSAKLAPPNFIIKNRENNHSHLVWALEFPIFKDYIQKARNLSYFAKIQQAYNEACKGDSSYVGLILKNPNHAHWQTIQVNAFYAYTLAELADFIELPKAINKKEAVGEGRNCFLFNSVRKWAYKEVLFYKVNADFKSFFYVILNRLEKANKFEQSSSLPYKEIWHIAKSVSKWTWKNFSIAKFSEIQTARSHKRKTVKNAELAKVAKYEFS